MTKKLITLISVLMILLLVLVVSAQKSFTQADIRNILENDDELAVHMGTVNGILEQIPSALTSSIFDANEIIHFKVGGSTVEATMSGGTIIAIRAGALNSPTLIAKARYSTLSDIAGSDNLPGAISEAIWSGKISIDGHSPCTSNLQCEDNQVCSSDGECKKAFTLVVTPYGYSEGQMSVFKQDAEGMVNDFLAKAPVDAEEVRVHYVDPKVCADISCDSNANACTDCNNKASQCARKAGLRGVADKVAAVTRESLAQEFNGQSWELCGCAASINSLSSITRSHAWCAQTFAHEVGHSLGLYHIDATGQEAGACNNPNAADCTESGKVTFVMGYGRPRSNFGPAATTHLNDEMGR
jgi:hypothetical protein